MKVKEWVFKYVGIDFKWDGPHVNGYIRKVGPFHVLVRV
jgi:hypothetical protein